MSLLRKKRVGMDIEEPQKKVIEFRGARDWAQYQGWRSEVTTSEISGQTIIPAGDQRKEIPSRKIKRERKEVYSNIMLDPGPLGLD
jgi:hypothetical protein